MTYFPVQTTQPKRLKSKRVKAMLKRMRTTHATAPQAEADSNKVPTATVKTKRRRKNVGNISKNQGLSSSGGFLKHAKTEVAADVLLSESSSGSDGDNDTSATTSVKTLQAGQTSQANALSGKSERSSVRRKKKASN